MTSPTASSPGPLDPMKELQRTRDWGGIHASTGQSGKTQYYGPPSYFYFIGEISSYLGAAFQQPHSAYHLEHNSANKSFASPTSPHGANSEQNQIVTHSANDRYLPRKKEEHFLRLFWQSYHCALQILDESEFREHYESLRTTSPTSRKPSALVDIVLAILMQYGIAFIPRSDRNKEPKGKIDSNDATIAGR